MLPSFRSIERNFLFYRKSVETVWSIERKELYVNEKIHEISKEIGLVWGADQIIMERCIKKIPYPPFTKER